MSTAGLHHHRGWVRRLVAPVVVALGPNAELDVWSAVQKVPGIAARRVLAIGGDFEAALQQEADTLAFDPQLAPDRVAALFERDEALRDRDAHVRPRAERVGDAEDVDQDRELVQAPPAAGADARA